MTIIEIKAQENGAHQNQTIDQGLKSIPDGWSVVPDEMEMENFPFGTVKAEKIDGAIKLVGWEPGNVPAPEPTPDEPEPTPAPTVWDEIAAAYQEGVNSIDE